MSIDEEIDKIRRNSPNSHRFIANQIGRIQSIQSNMNDTKNNRW